MPEEIEPQLEEKQNTSDGGRPNVSKAMTPPRWKEKLRANKFKILVGILVFLLFAGAIFGAYKIYQIRQAPRLKPCGPCLEIKPPGPDFCLDGTIIPGKIGECGCQWPPTCQNLTPTPGGKEEVEIGLEDSGKQVTLGVDQALILTLESNPTTGYGWELSEIDEAVLKQIYHEYTPDRPTLPGSGGQEVWRFMAENEGETALTLEYRRSWEEVEPIQVFSIEVVVQLKEEAFICVDKESLNCAEEIELSFQCTDKYQGWARENCPGWKETPSGEKVLCEDPRPQVCTMLCISNPPYICGSDGKSYCSECQACANPKVEWYKVQDESCGIE